LRRLKLLFVDACSIDLLPDPAVWNKQVTSHTVYLFTY
jgi:hypothetical protein